MKTKFKYDDIVQVLTSSGATNRTGERAWIVGVFEERPEGDFFKYFPEGVIYSIEFEDGSSIEVHENDIQLIQEKKVDKHIKYTLGLILFVGAIVTTYYVLTTNEARDEVVHSPSSSDELSDEKLKITLDAAMKNDISAVSKLVSHYGSVMSDNDEAEKEHDFWLEKLKDDARKGNPEAKKHFLDGNPD